MNAFDVPYDENLFESNEFMKSYWERSTEKKSIHFVQDLKTTEVMDQELRHATMNAFGNFGNFGSASYEPNGPHDNGDDVAGPHGADDLDDETLNDSVRVVDTTFNKKAKKHVLEPKSTNSTSVVWSILAMGAIFLFIINLKGSQLRE